MRCSGKINGKGCGSTLYKCTKCGSIGCKNKSNGKDCSNSIKKDSGGTCKTCGSYVKPI